MSCDCHKDTAVTVPYVTGDRQGRPEARPGHPVSLPDKRLWRQEARFDHSIWPQYLQVIDLTITVLL